MDPNAVTVSAASQRSGTAELQKKGTCRQPGNTHMQVDAEFNQPPEVHGISYFSETGDGDNFCASSPYLSNTPLYKHGIQVCLAAKDLRT